ncbi:methylated-DNA--[protein]-cysteine S-methyltransferase [Mucilaginibacter sabulilitoris]|uniref:Methylated-DNA--[protein]-cysteine S-methyltransferase n=1 Tax=Mucilaginibacter sabulilitoris TaxID=1173583 RepID=A0ABZ0TQJ6_9SPHI|nr:methylated-DNA--[protein]-cysteine S-methyltransferase [Mucilaginibacter sabulilitoris]WPU95046.1 methylated-DNA--[protein]-cysteine S-methyltransferase [Mucilaginibacter sabulilitoris]
MKNKSNESANEDTLLNKPAIINRINNTVLQLTNDAFTITEWEPEDNALPIFWKTADTTIGEVLIAATIKGVCFLGFTNGDRTFAFADLKRRFPGSIFPEKETEYIKEAVAHLNSPELNLPVHLHLKGTAFQLNVWKRLTLVPFGGITTYAALANGVRNARATGTAVGANPVSYILPCHRAVRSDGSFDRYYWGSEVKRKLLAYEDNER